MSSTGAAPRAAISHARAEASRRNGAKSRGPRTLAGKARSSRNALKHGLRAAKHVVLPAEDPAAFAALEAALLAELAPDGALQTVLARQIVAAVWRLARVDRMEVELLVFRDRAENDLGLAATRDANTARALPTLVRYRAAAHAELLRSLRTLEALQARRAKAGAAQAEQTKAAAAKAAAPKAGATKPGAVPEARTPAARAALAVARPSGPGASPDGDPAGPATLSPPAVARPNEPEPGAGTRRGWVLPDPAAPAALHEAAARWQPRPDRARPNEPEPQRPRGPARAGTERAPAPGAS